MTPGPLRPPPPRRPSEDPKPRLLDQSIGIIGHRRCGCLVFFTIDFFPPLRYADGKSVEQQVIEAVRGGATVYAVPLGRAFTEIEKHPLYCEQCRP